MPSMPPDFKLRFDRSEIGHWASRYSYPGESVVEDKIAAYARKNGHLTKESRRHRVLEVAARHEACQSNEEDFIRAHRFRSCLRNAAIIDSSHI